jgi:hypothetical protein
MARSVFPWVLVCCLWIFLSPAVPRAAEAIEGLIHQAADTIGQCLNGRGDATLAVTGIRASDGRINGLTAFLADSLTAQLAMNSNLNVLERARLKEIVKENGLSLDDLFDNSRAVQLGKLLSAHMMLNGTLTKMGRDFHLNLRVVDCETGRIVPGCGFRGSLKGSKDAMELWAQSSGLIVSVYPLDVRAAVYLEERFLGETGPGRNVISTGSVTPGEHTVKVVAPGYPPYRQGVGIEPLQYTSVEVRFTKPLRITFWQEDVATGAIIGNRGRVFSGRHYRFCFRSNRDCFVYVFNRGTSGRLFPLIPNERIRQENRILAETKTCIPEKGGFPIKGRPGTEKLWVLASLSPLPDLAAVAKGLLADPGTAQQGFERRVSRLKQKNLSKDYGLPDGPAISESVSLNPDDGVVMTLTYEHE